jgi:hypothetical protein
VCCPGFTRMPDIRLGCLASPDRLRLFPAGSPTHTDRIGFTAAPNMGACVTDWPFFPRCSPRRISATQLRFHIARFFTARGGLSPPSLSPSQAHWNGLPARPAGQPAQRNGKARSLGGQRSLAFAALLPFRRAGSPAAHAGSLCYPFRLCAAVELRPIFGVVSMPHCPILISG